MRIGAAISAGACAQLDAARAERPNLRHAGPPCRAASASAIPRPTLAAIAAATARARSDGLLGDPVGGNAVADLRQRGRGGADEAAQPDEQIAGVIGQGFDHRIVIGLELESGLERGRLRGGEAVGGVGAIDAGGGDQRGLGQASGGWRRPLRRCSTRPRSLPRPWRRGRAARPCACRRSSLAMISPRAWARLRPASPRDHRSRTTCQPRSDWIGPTTLPAAAAKAARATASPASVVNCARVCGPTLMSSALNPAVQSRRRSSPRRAPAPTIASAAALVGTTAWLMHARFAPAIESRYWRCNRRRSRARSARRWRPARGRSRRSAARAARAPCSAGGSARNRSAGRPRSGSARRGTRAVSTNTSSPRRCSSSIEA